MFTPLPPTERYRLMRAMANARIRYPTPVSVVLIDYLQAWGEFGYRISATSTPQKLLEHLLN